MERAFGGGSGSYTAPVARALSENIERMETIRRMFDEIGEEVAEQVREPGRRAFSDALRGQLDRRVQATAADEAAKWDKDHSYVPFSEVKTVEGKFSIKNPEFTADELRNNAIALQSMDAVKDLTGNEFSRNGKTLLENVTAFFDSLGNNVYSDVLGDVALDKRGVKSDIKHG